MKRSFIVLCLMMISGAAYADIASTGYVDSVVGALNIPAAANNSTITIKQTGLSDQSFTLDGSAKTITLKDDNTTYSAGTGISISGTTINNTAISQIRSGSSTATTFANIWLE